MSATNEQILAAARRAAEHAYRPYSQFAVGAAIAMGDGEVVTGCNVENASYGLTICAERNALFAAIARGYRADDMQALAIYTSGNDVPSSCGACRQVMVELLHADTPVIMSCDAQPATTVLVGDCLPNPFRLRT